MRVRGRVQNGVVVLRDPSSLSEGAEVLVEPLNGAGAPERGSPEALAQCSARWAGPASELDGLLAAVQAERDSELIADDRDE